MSNTIREYITGMDHFPNAKNMLVTATVQGKYGMSVQFGIGNDFIVLSENQVRDLVEVLKKRLKCVKGYSATDWGICKDVKVEEVKK